VSNSDFCFNFKLISQNSRAVESHLENFNHKITMDAFYLDFINPLTDQTLDKMIRFMTNLFSNNSNVWMSLQSTFQCNVRSCTSHKPNNCRQVAISYPLFKTQQNNNEQVTQTHTHTRRERERERTKI